MKRQMSSRLRHLLRTTTAFNENRAKRPPREQNFAALDDGSRRQPFHSTARQSKITLPPTPWDKETE